MAVFAMDLMSQSHSYQIPLNDYFSDTIQNTGPHTGQCGRLSWCAGCSPPHQHSPLSSLPCLKILLKAWGGYSLLLPHPVQSSLPPSDVVLAHFLCGWMLRRYIYVHVNYVKCFKRLKGNSFRQRDKPALRDGFYSWAWAVFNGPIRWQL